jgi:hypothetical protein
MASGIEIATSAGWNKNGKANLESFKSAFPASIAPKTARADNLFEPRRKKRLAPELDSHT